MLARALFFVSCRRLGAAPEWEPKPLELKGLFSRGVATALPHENRDFANTAKEAVQHSGAREKTRRLIDCTRVGL